MECRATAESSPRESKKELIDGFCDEISALHCIYNREEMEVLRERAAAAQLNEIERTDFYCIYCVLFPRALRCIFLRMILIFMPVRWSGCRK